MVDDESPQLVAKSPRPLASSPWGSSERSSGGRSSRHCPAEESLGHWVTKRNAKFTESFQSISAYFSQSPSISMNLHESPAHPWSKCAPWTESWAAHAAPSNESRDGWRPLAGSGDGSSPPSPGKEILTRETLRETNKAMENHQF